MNKLPNWCAVGFLAVITMLATACASSPGPVNAAWPSTPSQDATRVRSEWVREGTLRTSYQQTLFVRALPLAGPVRAADTAALAARRGANEAERAAMLAEAQAVTERVFELRVTTWDPEENDLHRGKQAVWQLELIDGDGTRVAPIKIERDLRPTHVLDAELSMGSDFAHAYRVTFPAGSAEGAWQLRVFGTRGHVELTWRLL